MAAKRSQHLAVVLTPKPSAGCGRDFGATGREYTSTACRQSAREEPSSVSGLSFRERQIVELIREAKTNKQIAFELSLTVGTVKEYVYHIFRKLGVTNRTELALRGC